jgi:pantothenate kinase
MRLRSVRVVVMILAAGLVALAAGCGGGGNKSSSSTTMHTSAASTTKKTTTSGSGSGSGSGSVPNFASAKNCQDLANLAATATSAITATSGNPAATLNTAAKQLQGLANAAPSDIRADFQTMATAFASFVQTLQKAGYTPSSGAPTAKQIAALTKAARSLNTPKVAQAQQHLNTWVKQNCKGVKVGG